MWMVNDSLQERVPSDLRIYHHVKSMLEYYEYWFADEPHLIVNEGGEAFKFISVDEKLEIVKRPELDLNQSEMSMFLEYIKKYDIRPQD